MKVAHAKFTVRHAQAVACCALLSLLAGCEKPAAVESQQASAAAPPALAEQLTAGEEVYNVNCAQCHYAGEGGANVPPLTGSPALADSARMFKIILQGQRNESVVQGQKFNGIMPGMAYLADEEIAAVTAYLRQRFGGNAAAIDPAQVAAERKRLGVD
jgi:mono/diheme cytochrome c family protein